jgi:hypothetical protein
MATLDDARKRYEQAMEQFKGKHYHCSICGIEGEYNKELKPDYVKIGEMGVLEGDTYTESVEAYFICKDREACKSRQESK